LKCLAGADVDVCAENVGNDAGYANDDDDASEVTIVTAMPTAVSYFPWY
jgi:hypothetical protein